MLRKNFPARQQQRRKAALERLKKQPARDEAHAKYLKGAIVALEEKIKSSVV